MHGLDFCKSNGDLVRFLHEIMNLIRIKFYPNKIHNCCSKF